MLTHVSRGAVMAMQKIFAREILDSRGNPTVEVDLHTAKGNTDPLYWFASENPQPHLLLPKSPTSCPLSDSLTDPLLFLAPELGEAGVSLYFLLSLGPGR